jgi:hypothetical protein
VYLKKGLATEIAKAELKIIEFCGRWKTLEGNYEQHYILRHFAAHLFAQQNKVHHQTLIALTKDVEYITTQKKVLRNFETTHQLFQNGIEIATKNNWNEAAIDCGLGIVDLKYEEHNDVTAILEMMKQNEIELTLQRITALGGLSKDDKQRQFIVIMLCIMELTLLESKTQPWRNNAIEKLLELMEEKIKIDHSVLNWNNFFPSYLMFLIAVELNSIDCDYLEIYKRTHYWNNEWIKNKGPYYEEELNVLIQTAETIKFDYFKSFAFIEIALVLTKQGKIEDSTFILDKLILLAEGINDDSDKSSLFKEIAVLLASQGKIEKSIQIVEDFDDIDSEKSIALKEIVVVLANQ